MNAFTRPAWSRTALLSLTLALLAGAGLSSPSQATPPTPPAEIRLPGDEAIARLRPAERRFSLPLEIRAHQAIEDAVIVIRSKPVRRSDAGGVEVREIALGRLVSGTSERRAIDLPVAAGAVPRRIEVMLSIRAGEREGVVSSRVLYSLEIDGTARLRSAAEQRDAEVEPRGNGQLRRQGGLERAGLEHAPRAGRLVPVAPADAARVRPGRGPEHLRVRGRDRPQAEAGGAGDAAERARLRAQGGLSVAPVAPVVILHAEGQIVFEDFWTDIPLDPLAPGVLTPLANATVELFQRPTGGVGPSYFVGSTETDANGSWSIDAVPYVDGYPFYYTVSLDNARLRVEDAALNDYVWASALEEGRWHDFGQQQLDDNVEAAQIYAILDRGWNHITGEGGQDPGLIVTRYPDACQIDMDPDPVVVDLQPSDCWDPGDGVIRLEADSNASPDVVLHEYGHALMHAAFGQSLGGGVHSFADFEQPPGQAYSEGWATAFAMAVCPDGVFNFSETTGTSIYENADEWPACVTSYDFGTLIELFCHDCDFSSGDDPSDDNRSGWLQEGRVAAALNDLIDGADDDNDGVVDRGLTGYSDANAGQTIGLAQIYRDTMFGYLHEDYTQFYTALQGDLDTATRELAADIQVYNYMAIPAPGAPLQCVASKIAVAESPDHDDLLAGLRSFRDRVLKPLQEGRPWIQTYYRHSPEMAMLLIRSSQARDAAMTIVRHFAEIGRAFETAQGINRLARATTPAVPPRVSNAIERLARAIEAGGSAELKADLARAQDTLRPFLSADQAQAVRMVGSMAAITDPRTAPVIRPHDHAPASRRVDWQLIRSHVPDALAAVP